MKTQTAEDLSSRKCVPCEGGLERFELPEAESMLQLLTGWRLTHGGTRIRKDWRVKNFVAGVDFFSKVAEVAEKEGHHPDLHLERYQKMWIDIRTHAIKGLSENDFILAAKIDQLPVLLRS